MKSLKIKFWHSKRVDFQFCENLTHFSGFLVLRSVKVLYWEHNCLWILDIFRVFFLLKNHIHAEKYLNHKGCVFIAWAHSCSPHETTFQAPQNPPGNTWTLLSLNNYSWFLTSEHSFDFGNLGYNMTQISEGKLSWFMAHNLLFRETSWVFPLCMWMHPFKFCNLRVLPPGWCLEVMMMVITIILI